jgi:hypothetical protein
LGTVTDCRQCGEACTGGTPFCDPAGCVDHRDIVVVNSSLHTVQGWASALSTPSEIKLSHTLATSAGNNRMLLAGVAATDQFLAPEAIAVTYNGVPMVAAVKKLDQAAQSFAGIYYLLDAQLPAKGAREAKAVFGPSFSWGHGGLHIVELKNVAQVAPFVTGSAAGDASCGAGALRSVSLTYTQPGSLVYGMLGARGASSASFSVGPGLVESWNQLLSSPDKMMAASAYVIDDDSRTLSWNIVACYNSAMAAVAIKRLSAF